MSMDSKMNKREIIQIGSKMRGRKKKATRLPPPVLLISTSSFRWHKKKTSSAVRLTELQVINETAQQLLQ